MKLWVGIAFVAMCGASIGLDCRPSAAPTTPASQAAASGPGSIEPTTNSIPITRYTNGRRIAEVITWHGESALTVYEEGVTTGPGKAATGAGPYRLSFFENSNNGSYVMDAAWSPKGTYFAFKLASAGGHMPYRSPVRILNLDTRKLIDAEEIIRKIHGISNIAVSHEEEPYIKWLSDTKLQVSVMAHDKPSDAGMYVIDMVTLRAQRPSTRPAQSP